MFPSSLNRVAVFICFFIFTQCASVRTERRDSPVAQRPRFASVDNDVCQIDSSLRQMLSREYALSETQRFTFMVGSQEVIEEDTAQGIRGELKVSRDTEPVAHRFVNAPSCEEVNRAVQLIAKTLIEKYVTLARPASPPISKPQLARTRLGIQAGIRSGLNASVAPIFGLSFEVLGQQKNIHPQLELSFKASAIRYENLGNTLVNQLYLFGAKTCPIAPGVLNQKLIFPMCAGIEVGAFVSHHLLTPSAVVYAFTLSPQLSTGIDLTVTRRIIARVYVIAMANVFRPKVTRDTVVLYHSPLFGAETGIAFVINFD